MSSKILFITVGGSFQPIVTSIRNLNPDRVIFICSGGNQGSDSQVIGKNKPCEVRKGAEVIDKLPNIPEQLNLGDKFQAERDLIVVNNPDDLSECYQRITEKVRQVQQESPDAQFMADYTGGTKTMSVSLGLAALDYHPPLLAQYNYPAAIAELNNLLTTMELSFNDSQQIQKQLDLCYGFNLWDCFEHSEAWEYLSPYLKDEKLRPHLFFLKRVMGNREKVALAVNDKFTAPEKMKGHNYEIVEDILLNAERRATVKRYDDAVARLYRALELFAQVRLFNEYELISGNLELDKLPQSLRPNYEKLRSDKGYIQIGLRQAYLLLTELKDTGLSELYAKYESGIFDKLQIRNYSILAHGLSPINQSEYHKFAQIIKEFIREGLQNCVSKKDSSLLFSQFPTAF
jgi:hypothetical protein